MTTLSAAEIEQARALVALYDERVRMTADLAEDPHLTGAKVDAVLAKGRELDAACEAFRRRFYPRRARVVVGLWNVLTVSPMGRTTHSVLDLFDEYHGKAAS